MQTYRAEQKGLVFCAKEFGPRPESFREALKHQQGDNKVMVLYLEMILVAAWRKDELDEGRVLLSQQHEGYHYDPDEARKILFSAKKTHSKDVQEEHSEALMTNYLWGLTRMIEKITSCL